ncbi:MAG: phosphonate ABC transporter ATP-binding protein [bacterium]
MLDITHLRKEFGATIALDDVSLRIRQGEMVGIIGRSGAGKSTLLRAVNRLVEPTAGSIRHDERDVTSLKGQHLRQWRRHCAMIFQQFNLVSRLDVLTNVLVGRVSYQPTIRSLLKMFTPAERALAVLTLDRVEMTPFVLQRADTLSGGQQQRVAIARALVQEPKIILADEPIASLDPRSARRVMEILRNVNQQDGITVMCNLHTLDTARAYCDRVIGMSAGRVVFDGAPDELDDATVREVYGVEGDDGDFDESVTSTAIPFPRPVHLEQPIHPDEAIPPRRHAVND